MDCVGFLQWALPRMGMRWKGFRKVRRQVCRRIRRRIGRLGLAGEQAYRDHLLSHPEEWEHLRGLCRVTISRFRRDRGVWQALEDRVLPELARLDPESGGGIPPPGPGAPAIPLRAWSAGCASGEEPYTLSLLWELRLARDHPHRRMEILATDVDPVVLERAREGVYSRSSLRELPSEWVTAGFVEGPGGAEEERFRIREAFRDPITFRRADLLDGRDPDGRPLSPIGPGNDTGGPPDGSAPAGPFHLILCRNLLLTYWDQATAADALERLLERLIPGGALVVGSHERLPESRDWPLERWVRGEPVFRKAG